MVLMAKEKNVKEIWLLGLLQKAFYIIKLQVHLKDQFLSSIKAPEHILQCHYYYYMYFWTIWENRNSSIFKNSVAEIEDILETVKFRAWLWLKNKISRANMSWFEWSSNPFLCFISYCL